MDRCTESLQVQIDHSQGGWSSSNCDITLDVDCPNMRCYWWDRAEQRRTITAADLATLQTEHDNREA